MDSMEVLNQNLAVAVNFQPYSAAELKDLRDECRQFAADGRQDVRQVLRQGRARTASFPPD